uniref:Uncharacterized protein n=1 Tax=Cacopsylla melanoneura TaxID=428564 RepID=A0A8D8QZX5_9HEMI
MKHFELASSISIRTEHKTKIQLGHQVKEAILAHLSDRSVCNNLLLFRKNRRVDLDPLTNVVTKTVVNSACTVVMDVVKINEEVIQTVVTPCSRENGGQEPI